MDDAQFDASDFGEIRIENAWETEPVAPECELIGSGAPAGAADNPVLRKNLLALAHRNPDAARLIEGTRPSGEIRFIEGEDGLLSAEYKGVALASKRRPGHEAQRLAERIDPLKVACCAVLGFGLGHHCVELQKRLGSQGVIVCFEPDAALLRAVLGRIDCSALFASGRVLLVTDPEDSTALTRMFSRVMGIVGLGVEILAHPPSTARLGESADRFGRVFGDMLKAARTHVVTTLANSRFSFRNGLMNLDHYAMDSGIAPLKDNCRGRAAIVVSAGPSLERNIELLSDPAVRDSFVIIAVQTVLKPLLARGIRPHFVAALDYHELSKRFYEGLSGQDVEGIRLIVEAKANPAILDAFPGEVLCVQDEQIDRLLGDGLVREMGTIPVGATVAHLCYYIARYLGCDPVILVGQDLGFSDGQYYAAGAAIHQVWGCELSAHNTLEMMEWQRIVRMRTHLRQRTDVHGRPIYSDEQMSTYLAQFESDFQSDAEGGLTVIDASEGGVRKAHTVVMGLKDAIERCGGGAISLPATAGRRVWSDQRRAALGARLGALIDDCQRIARMSEQSVALLGQMLDQQHDQGRVNGFIGRVNGLRDRVMKLDSAFYLIQCVNQIGVLNRIKRDREIELYCGDDPIERQRLQIRRDITNVEWTRDAALSVARQLRAGREALLGRAPKQTNELEEINEDKRQDKRQDKGRDKEEDGSRAGRMIAAPSGIEPGGSEGPGPRDRVEALVLADPTMGGLGNPRDLGAKITGRFNALQMTIARVDCAERIAGITILTPDPGAVRALLGSMPTRHTLRIVGVDAGRMRRRAARIGAARVQSSDCWRGSIGLLGACDEQLDPVLAAGVMESEHIEACAIVGADWVMVDPGLIDGTIGRYRAQNAEKRIAFSQAPPGLGTFVVDRATMGSLADSITGSDSGRNHFATLAALIGYIPMAPQFDPIAKAMCAPVEAFVRDAGARFVADTTARIAMMRDAYKALGSDPAAAMDPGACVRAYLDASARYNRICPRTIVLETCTGRLAGGDWGVWKRNSIEPIERAALDINDAHALLREAGSIRDDLALVFDGVGDPLMHPGALPLIQLAKEDGIACVELRTDLLREGIGAGELIESGIDILSVDLLAQHATTYAALTGTDRFEQVYRRIQSIFDAMRESDAPAPWFVPRITRCDLVYEEIEPFFDKWLMLCGSAIIDPLPQRISNQRIQSLPIPAIRQHQLDRGTMRIRCDGVVVDRIGRPIGGRGQSINAIEEGVSQAYQRMCAAMRSRRAEPKPVSPAASEEHAA